MRGSGPSGAGFHGEYFTFPTTVPGAKVATLAMVVAVALGPVPLATTVRKGAIPVVTCHSASNPTTRGWTGSPRRVLTPLFFKSFAFWAHCTRHSRVGFWASAAMMMMPVASKMKPRTTRRRYAAEFTP